MLEIKNYKKLEGLKFGDWTCGIAEEYGPYYRFSFREGDIPNLGWKKSFWIEVERNVFTDADGDRVINLNFPNRKIITRMSLRYMSDINNIIKNFTDIIRKNGKD